MSSTDMSPTRASLASESAAYYLLQITYNANIARNPDKHNLLPICGQIHIKFPNLHKITVAICIDR